MSKRLETIQIKIKRQNENVEEYNRKIAEPFVYKDELNTKRGVINGGKWNYQG